MDVVICLKRGTATILQTDQVLHEVYISSPRAARICDLGIGGAVQTAGRSLFSFHQTDSEAIA